MDETPRSPEDIPNWSPPLAGKLVAKSKPGEARAWHPSGSSKTHQGIDLPAPVGTPVQSIGDGKVVAVVSDWAPGKDAKQFGGNFIIVQHPNGVRSKYMHLSEINVKVGQTVTGGEQIGKSGDTGGKRSGDAHQPAMDPHLHFAIEDTDPATGKVIRDPVTRKAINFDPTKFLQLNSTSPAGQSYSHDRSIPAPDGGFLSKLRGVLGLEEKKAPQPAKRFSEEDFSRLKDISRRVLENERKLGNLTNDQRDTEQDLDAEGLEGLKRGRQWEETLKRGSTNHVHDAGARLQQQTDIQRLQRMASERASRSRQLIQDIETRNRLQMNLARETQRRLGERNVREAQTRQQAAEDAQRRSAQRMQDVQRHQDEARRNEQIRMAQQRAGELARRDQQLRQDQLNRIMTATTRPPLTFENHFTKPFVNPHFGGTTPKPIWLPAHIYTAPVVMPRPPSHSPFSRPNNNIGHLFS